MVALRKKARRKAKRSRPDVDGSLPPRLKTSRAHIVAKGFAWDDLQKALHQSSGRGPERVVHLAIVQKVSGLDLRRRIHKLGFSASEFARRHGMSVNLLYEMTHYPAGALMTRYIRLVEFEEFMAGVADVISEESLDVEEIRRRLEAILDAQVALL